ncbi:glycosyltransferase family 61 protein [Halorubrum lipolyticum]|uniref:Capsular polysaccharide biosynthesis protein-like protein n=1 Tax=Halorubrum lipolyticum DSM 21995 TaxID=1227482 RepID=M0NLB2_9EURY|nr:glycosyltransferase family 61 protein [Halorubrum lipolyticum]EMA58378.1 capsular polysaccharide biosynthesis protein-like protein [Halorubrum lipolyticum DSM 21995]
MKNQSILRDIRRHYQKNGARSLVRSTFNHPVFADWPVVGHAINSAYPRYLVTSDELKSEYCTTYEELAEDLDGLHYGLNEEIAPLQDDPSLEYNYYPRFSFEQPFVASVPDVTVAGEFPIAIADDGKVLVDTLNSFTDGAGWRTGGAIKQAISGSPITVGTALLRGRAPTSKRAIPVAAIVNGYWGNFYHWTLEELLKLRGIKQYERRTGRDVPLLIPSDPKSYVTESLRLLGYDDADYIEWDGEPLHVDRLIVPSFPDPTPLAMEWLRNEATDGLDLSDDTGPDWVYVSRQNADTRRVANYAEIQPVLEEYGIEPVECETLSLDEQIRLFSSVEGIVGPHGAGLTGLVWSSDLDVVEIFNNVVKGPYYVLAHVLGHDYTALSGEPVGDIPNGRERDIRVDSRRFRDVLSQIVC